MEIDLMPKGMTTPEGAARAVRAAENLETAISNVAHGFNEIWHEVLAARHRPINADWLIAVMEDHMDRWHKASEELARAVAGR